MANFQQNTDGSWSMAVPLPMYTYSWFRSRYQCACTAVFKTVEAYERHYQLWHTDGNRYTRTPKGMEVKPKPTKKGDS